jgi:hypothetical protein
MCGLFFGESLGEFFQFSQSRSQLFIYLLVLHWYILVISLVFLHSYY